MNQDSNEFSGHAPFKSKTVAVWAALLFGWIGAHWFYLRRRRAWLYVLCPPIAFFAGCLDALVIGLMPDERFNRTYNSHCLKSPVQTNGLTIFGIILALALGVGSLVSLLAIAFQWFFTGTFG
ncbi:MAG: NINE protein [Burkholderiaceae bacterium]|jgi:hypothetical protein